VSGPLPVIVYTHGAGWVFGNAHTHDRPDSRADCRHRRCGRVHQLQSLARGADASFDTDSYHRFAEGYFLRDAMQWFWDQSTTDGHERNEITASPLRATHDDLTGLPTELVITGEADVLRGKARRIRARPARPGST
jgi:acetyl esterase/lipase